MIIIFSFCFLVVQKYSQELFTFIISFTVQDCRNKYEIYGLEEKLGAIECDSGNAEVQWKNIKECVLDTISDLVGKVEKRARKPWIKTGNDQ